MVAAVTPWTTSTEVDGNQVVVTVMMSTDAGPMREFRPFLDVVLDETHALVLFGELGLALQALSDARAARTVVPFPGKRS
jgi:hypothetical protein